jgi:hypothetical protein
VRDENLGTLLDVNLAARVAPIDKLRSVAALVRLSHSGFRPSNAAFQQRRHLIASAAAGCEHGLASL